MSKNNVEDWEYKAISDVSYRWNVSPEEAELFLESIGFYDRPSGAKNEEHTNPEEDEAQQ